MTGSRNKASTLSSHKEQAEVVLRNARERYGDNWELLSRQDRQGILERGVLKLIQDQRDPQFKPARDMARGVLRELAPKLEDELAIEAAEEAGYEVKQNCVVNVGYYFVPTGDRDDSPSTYPSITEAWLAVMQRDGIAHEPSPSMS